eukprot:TRINITY_DN21031_c0_g1_i1.p1 TRINITY_DN21031_c0_g1~~TRINITY_DN21031_c0_g1_i1.p1  ORF type:complete len:304 (-),score=63.14 TRINITY_DN21031_c0_g1_i1:115-1026(-)
MAMRREKGAKERLKHGGFEFRKSEGQHILCNPLVIENIIDKAGITGTDRVLEIGPGTGNMTTKMLERAKKVTAFEVDSRMVYELRKRFAGTEAATKFELVHGDFLQQPLPYFDVCCANVPYQISSPIVFKLLAHRPAFRCAVLMFQKEFSLRLAARPGSDDWCRLSVNTQVLAKVEHVLNVGRNNFKPPPKVDSSVVRITPHKHPIEVDYEEWDGLVRLCFVRKNKTLGALFKPKSVVEMLEKNFTTFCALHNTPVPMDLEMKEKIMDVLVKNEFDQLRPSKMDIDDFLKLLMAFNQEGIHFS